jgi:hypothetical protein
MLGADSGILAARCVLGDKSVMTAADNLETTAGDNSGMTAADNLEMTAVDNSGMTVGNY